MKQTAAIAETGVSASYRARIFPRENGAHFRSSENREAMQMYAFAFKPGCMGMPLSPIYGRKGMEQRQSEVWFI